MIKVFNIKIILWNILSQWFHKFINHHLMIINLQKKFLKHQKLKFLQNKILQTVLIMIKKFIILLIKIDHLKIKINYSKKINSSFQKY